MEATLTEAARRKANRDRVKAHRDRLRAQGLRPVQIWLPDVTTPEFKAEAHRQALAIAASEDEARVMALIEELSDWDDLG